MPDYRNMSSVEALRYAKEQSGFTAEELAYKLEISPAVMNRYLRQDGGYSPSLEMIPKMCRALGNNVLIDWLKAQAEISEDVKPAKNRAEVLTAVARATVALGDVSKILVASEKTGIDSVKAKAIRAGLAEVKDACPAVQGQLQEVAAPKFEPFVLYQRG